MAAPTPTVYRSGITAADHNPLNGKDSAGVSIPLMPCIGQPGVTVQAKFTHAADSVTVCLELWSQDSAGNKKRLGVTDVAPLTAGASQDADDANKYLAPVYAFDVNGESREPRSNSVVTHFAVIVTAASITAANTSDLWAWSY